MASTPPVDRDALTHHLAIPKLYIEHGGIYEIPDIEFSYYPQLLELIYAIPLFFGNDIIPKYIHFGMALFSSFFVYKILRQRASLYAACAGALFFLSLPVIVKLSVTVYVDLGLIFFSFLSLYYLIKWQRLEKLRYLVFSALSCGFAMSCKYNGLIVFMLMMFAVIWLSEKKVAKSKFVIERACLFCIVAIIIFSPWLVKNYLWTKNPVYPLYNSLFNPSDSHTGLAGGESVKKSHFYYRRVVHGESFFETITTPVRIFFQGRDDDPKYFDGRLNPFLFFLPIISMIVEVVRYMKKKLPDHEKILLFSFAWAYIIFVYVQTDMRIRWIGPAIAPLTVLSFIGLGELWQIIKKKFGCSGLTIKSAFAIIIIAMFSMNYNYFFELYKKIDPIPYLSGKISRGEYIQNQRPEYSAYQYINQKVDRNAKIFGLFVGNRRYYCDRPMVTDENVFRKFTNNANSAKDIFNNLTNIRITHFVVGEELYSSWLSGVFDDDHQKIILDFWRLHARLIFRAYGYSVYEIIK